MTEAELQKVATMEKFLKEAFCVDGPVKLLGFDKLEILKETVMTFELTDSKRGKFNVSLSQK